MQTTLLILYATVLTGLGFFGLHRLKMLWIYWRASRHTPALGALPSPSDARMCVQCPLYNEPLMVTGLLEAVTALDWPEDQLEIQILDDSTDETSELIARWLKANRRRARCVRHIRRAVRSGYKAGALTHGMAQSEAEFFAIFDADFRPAPDFLRRTMTGFADPRVAVVQARWEFSNRDTSLLTRFQSIFLDAHFIVEQAARAAGGLFFNFNGTAGVWRRSALEDAGGWTADTVTEDLDISYRAQLRGWRFIYLERYSVPSELPETLAAFKAQQRRWTKGGIQVQRKLLRPILASKQPGRIKREAFTHLTIGFVHPLLVAFSLLFVPFLWVVGVHPDNAGWAMLNPLWVLVVGGSAVALYMTGQYFRQREWRQGLLWLVLAPLMFSFGLALSVSCTAAAIEGWFARGGEFVRTPKGGRAARQLPSARSRGIDWLLTGVTAVELGIGALLLTGAVHFLGEGYRYLAWVLAIKAVGFIGFGVITLLDQLRRFAVPVRKPCRVILASEVQPQPTPVRAVS